MATKKKPRRGGSTRSLLKAQSTRFSNPLTAHGAPKQREGDTPRPITLARVPSLEKPLEGEGA